MSTSLTLHDVEKITLKRKSAQQDKGMHYWTTLVITHRASGNDAEGEYGDITTKTEITLHHHGSIKVPFKIEGKVRS